MIVPELLSKAYESDTKQYTVKSVEYKDDKVVLKTQDSTLTIPNKDIKGTKKTNSYVSIITSDSSYKLISDFQDELYENLLKISNQQVLRSN